MGGTHSLHVRELALKAVRGYLKRLGELQTRATNGADSATLLALAILTPLPAEIDQVELMDKEMVQAAWDCVSVAAGANCEEDSASACLGSGRGPDQAHDEKGHQGIGPDEMGSSPGSGDNPDSELDTGITEESELDTGIMEESELDTGVTEDSEPETGIMAEAVWEEFEVDIADGDAVNSSSCQFDDWLEAGPTSDPWVADDDDDPGWSTSSETSPTATGMSFPVIDYAEANRILARPGSITVRDLRAIHEHIAKASQIKCAIRENIQARRERASMTSARWGCTGVDGRTTLLKHRGTRSRLIFSQSVAEAAAAAAEEARRVIW